MKRVALFTRAWIEIFLSFHCLYYNASPSLRGRGLKYRWNVLLRFKPKVALFTRAWIEIILYNTKYLKRLRRPLYEGVDWNIQIILAVCLSVLVALFTRAWIEMLPYHLALIDRRVALFTRAWIEIAVIISTNVYHDVALFTRAWIEIMF